MNVRIALLLLGLLGAASLSLRTPAARRALRLGCRSDGAGGDGEFVTVEVRAASSVSARAEETRVLGYQSLYEEAHEKSVQRALVTNPALRTISLLFNPTTLLFAVYFSGIAWNKVQWMQKLLGLFGKAAPKEDPVALLPFQTFECEGCQMEMRPARGRAEAILGRPRFRCSKCGAKASSYFDVDDLEDPRAVARLERIKSAERDDGDDEDEGEGSDDE